MSKDKQPVLNPGDKIICNEKDNHVWYDNMKEARVSYEWKIEDHTKTYTSRYIPLIPKAVDILETIISKHRRAYAKSDYIYKKW